MKHPAGLIALFLAYSFITSAFAADLEKAQGPIKAALQKARAKLGDLEPWQKDLFDNEIVTQLYPQFVLKSSGTQVDIDVSGLSHYIRYHASAQPQNASINAGENQGDVQGTSILATTRLQERPKILVLAKTDPKCTKCAESSPAILNLVRARLEKRGFQLDLYPSDEISTQLTGNAIEDRLEALAKQRGELGYFSVRWSSALVDDLDTAHADDKKFIIRASLQITGVGSVSHEQEILDTGSFRDTLGRLWIDVMTDLGKKMDENQALLAEQGKEEYLIEVAGIQDFRQFVKAKSHLKNIFKDMGSVEERVVSKEKFVFAIYTKKSRDEIKKKVNDLTGDPNLGRSLVVTLQ